MERYLITLPEGYDEKQQRMVALFAWQLDDQLARLKRIAKSLTVDQLQWQPQPGMNTVGMLLAHIAVAETYWLKVAVAGLPFEPDGDRIIRETIGIGGNDDGLPLSAEGRHPEVLSGKTVSDYFAMLEAARSASHVVLRGWSDADLQQTYLQGKQRFDFGWTLYHVLEHLGAHLGQVSLLLHLMRDHGVLTDRDSG